MTPVTTAASAASSDMLRPYLGLQINYQAGRRVCTYAPSSLMMDYIVHLINRLLCDNFYLKRQFPEGYHPYILRLYYGVLFWIQCLRAGIHAGIVDDDGHQTVTRFLSNFPPESLPISGPLLNLFKTLCCSQPELATYGLVCPELPAFPGPATRSLFMNADPRSYIIPNVPGIFALLEHLQTKIAPAYGRAVYPSKGGHTPVTANATAVTVFGHHNFPVPNERTDEDKWALCSSGLQYPCEADMKLHENFAETIDNFPFPQAAATDDLRTYGAFLHINGSMAWFARVRDIAAAGASIFNGSGTV